MVGAQGNAGVAQLVERKPSKLDVAGSSPVSRSGESLPGDRQLNGADQFGGPPQQSWRLVASVGPAMAGWRRAAWLA